MAVALPAVKAADTICSDFQHILPGPSSDTNAVSSDCAYHVGNEKVEGDLDMQVEEEFKVKTEKGVGSEEEECIDIKDEESMCTEEEVKEEHIITKLFFLNDIMCTGTKLHMHVYGIHA